MARIRGSRLRNCVTADRHVVEIDDKHIAFRDTDAEGRAIWRAAVMPERLRDGSTNKCILYAETDRETRQERIPLGALQLSAVVDFAHKRIDDKPPPHSRGFPILPYYLSEEYVCELVLERAERKGQRKGLYRF